MNDSAAVNAPLRTAAPADTGTVVGPIRAQAMRDSAAAAVPDTSGRGEAEARRYANRLSEQPRIVMLRSLVVPGWGQLHNHAWLKAAGVAATETWLVSTILKDRKDLDKLRDQANALADSSNQAGYIVAVNRYNDRLDGFVSAQWLLGGLLAYALVDAYVDAHFKRFDIEFRTDPALPRDVTPEDGRGGAPPGGTGGRLSLEWHF